MDDNLRSIIVKRIEKTIKNLEKNNMQGFYVESKADVADKVRELMSEGQTVAVGGSMTLFECGVIDLLRSGSYRFLDRYAGDMTRDDAEKIYRQSFSRTHTCARQCHNRERRAVQRGRQQQQGAAICYGPKSVIIVRI